MGHLGHLPGRWLLKRWLKHEGDHCWVSPLSGVLVRLLLL